MKNKLTCLFGYHNWIALEKARPGVHGTYKCKFCPILTIGITPSNKAIHPYLVVEETQQDYYVRTTDLKKGQWYYEVSKKTLNFRALSTVEVKQFRRKYGK